MESEKTIKSNKKKIAIFIDSMSIGGAERVISVLCQEFVKEYQVDLLMLYKREIKYYLPEQVNVFYVEDMPITSTWGKLIRFAFSKWNYLRSRVYVPFLRRIGIKSYAKWNETKFYMFSRFAIPYREYLQKSNADVSMGFLIRSNIAMLMAAKGLNVKTFFCERNNPIRPDMPKNIIKIRDRIYPRCNAAVFQTEEERKYYYKLRCQSTVIPNPVKEGLPERFAGERKKEIVNFCRLSKQKNISLLIDAFEMLLYDYPDYKLKIYGDGEEEYSLKEYVKRKKLENAVSIESFAVDVHARIVDTTMFVSTSDFEGLSNSMLEAMAIGLPCVCTDCDGGGARMMIRDHENGLLVPKGDVDAVYRAMKEIIENPSLARKLSEEGTKLREELSTERIVQKWMEVLK